MSDRMEDFEKRLGKLERRVFRLDHLPTLCRYCGWMPFIQKMEEKGLQVVCGNEMCWTRGPLKPQAEDAVAAWNDQMDSE